MNAPTRIQEPGTRRKAAGLLIVAACVLACTLAIIGGRTDEQEQRSGSPAA